MGLYNRLHITAACVRCEQVVDRVLQFKFGECWVYDYTIGDSVSWEKAMTNTTYGEPIDGHAWVPAYAEEPCPNCEADCHLAEFAVVLAGDTLVGFEQAPAKHNFSEASDVFRLSGSEERPVPSYNGIEEGGRPSS